MSNQLKTLQKAASHLAWPVIATAAVVLGGVTLNNAFQVKEPVGAVANLALAAVITGLTDPTKKMNQLRRDKELGIIGEDGDTTITTQNFVVAAARHEDLDRQTKILATVSTGLCVLVPVVPPAAFGAGAVLLSMGVATITRETELLTPLQDAARQIKQDGSGLNNQAIKKALEYVGRCYL